jgi:hypothetical protein
MGAAIPSFPHVIMTLRHLTLHYIYVVLDTEKQREM